MKQSMIFYFSWKEAIKDLPDSVRLEVYEAAIDFASTGVVTEMSELASLAFSFIKQSIVSDAAKYESICEKRRESIMKRWEKKPIQESTSDTNVYNSIQKVQADTNDTDNDNEYDNDIKKKGVSKDTPKESEMLSPPPVEIDLNKIMDFFNDEMKKHNALIPSIRSIQGQRKTHTLARIREHGKEALAKMIRTAAASDFLNGKNERAWVANYDWLVSPSNFVKVIEGNYSSRNGRNTQRNPEGGSGLTEGTGYDSSL